MILVVRETGNEGSDALGETYIDGKLEGEGGMGREDPCSNSFQKSLNGSFLLLYFFYNRDYVSSIVPRPLWEV